MEFIKNLFKKKQEETSEIKYFNNQTNNDRWIVDLYKGEKNGYFVEAGALDGIGGSCTYTLERYFNWRGLLVEPGLPFGALVKNRPNSICENVCLSDKKDTVLFVDATSFGFSGVKGKLIEEDFKHKAKWGKTREFWKEGDYKERTVEAIPFYDLLIKHNAPKKIEYVAFDMEGSEYAVLKNFPFDEFNILAFSIEGDSCNELLLSRGYRMVKNPFNTEAPWEYYFVHEAFKPLSKKQTI